MSSEAPERAQLIEDLELALRKTTGQSVLHSQAVADRVKINPTDLECLDILSMVGPVPAGALAEATGLTTGAITGVVDRLEARGYARREKDPSDRRRVIIHPLTEAAWQDIGHVYAPFQQAMASLYERYSDDELTVILDFIERANDAVREQIARLRSEEASWGAASSGSATTDE